MVGAIVLLGWLLGLQAPKSIVAGWAEMAPLTALSFVLLGTSICFTAWSVPAPENAKPGMAWLGPLAAFEAIFVGATGLFRLAEYIFGWGFAIDHLGATVPGSTAKMAPATAFNFVVLGAAIWLTKATKFRGLRQILPLVSGLVAWLGFSHYLYGGAALLPYSQMSIHSAGLFLFASAAVLALRPDYGLMQLLLSKTAGGTMARRLVPAALVAPILLGWLRLAGQRAGLYGTEAGIALLALGNIFVFGGLIWKHARLLAASDQDRQSAEAALVLKERRFRALIEHSGDAKLIIGADFKIAYASPSVAKVEGRSASDLAGRSPEEHTHPDDLTMLRQLISSGPGRSGEAMPVLWRRRHQDGHWLWLEGVATHLLDDPAVEGVILNYRDITARKLADERAVWLASFPERNPNPIVELDLVSGFIHYVNPTAAWLFPDLQRQGLQHPWLAGLSESVGGLLGGATQAVRRVVTLGDASFAQTISYVPEARRLRIYSTDVTASRKAEEALAREHGFLRLLIDNLPACIYVKDLEGRFRTFNRASLGMVGLENESDALGKTVHDFFPPEIADIYRADDLQVLSTGVPVLDRDEPTQDAGGRRRWFLTTKIPLRDARGQQIGLLGISRDNTERKETERLVERQRAELQLIFDSVPALIFYKDVAGKFLRVNGEMARLIGLPKEHIEGRTEAELGSPYADEHAAEDQAVIAQGVARRRSVQRLHTASGMRWIEVDKLPDFDEQGTIKGIIGFAVDITERRLAETALARERNLLRVLIDNLPAFIYLKDLAGHYLVTNRANLDALGVASEAGTAGKTVYDFFPYEIADQFEAGDRQVINSGAPLVDAEMQVWNKRGPSGWLSTTKIPVRGEDGKINAVLGISFDITERKRAAQELQESQRRFQTLAESMPQLVWTCRADGWCDYLSRQWVEYTGRPAEEQLGSGWAEFVHPDDRPRLLEMWSRSVTLGQQLDVEFRIRRHDGAYRWFKTRAAPVKDALGQIVRWFGTNTDFDDLKQSEEKLQTQLARLGLLQQLTRAIGERQDLASIFQVVVGSLEEHLPLDFACICRHDASRLALRVISVGGKSSALAEGIAMGENAIISIDQNGLSRCVAGSLVYEADLSRVDFPFPKRLADAGLRSVVLAPLLVDRDVFGVLIAGRCAAGAFSSGDCEFLRQLSEHIGLAAHQVGLREALQEAYEDLRRSQQTAMQQERLRALGQMASGIAHDINNALSPVALYTEALLENEPGLSDRAREYLTTIGCAIEDVSTTVARMREFYRQREPEMTLGPVNLNQLAQQVADLTRVRWSDMPQQRGVVVNLVYDLAPELPPVMGVAGEIRDALTNLILNAVDAMPQGGTLLLRTRIAERQAAIPGPAPQVQIEVVDTGTGMDEETRRQCLEPFFTTKGERGTGLGLAMVYGMVKRHSAGLEIETSPGAGTTVRLSFEIPSTAVELARTPAPSVPASVPPLRLLLVDDDPLILKSLGKILEMDGHTVTIAGGGKAGIDTFETTLKEGAGFAAVITDLGMPYVDGRKVACAIKAMSPLTPVIMLTGWGQRLVNEGDVPAQVDVMLGKPPKLADLRAALAKLCSKPDPGGAGMSGGPPPA